MFLILSYFLSYYIIFSRGWESGSGSPVFEVILIFILSSSFLDSFNLLDFLSYDYILQILIHDILPKNCSLKSEFYTWMLAF